MKKLAEVLKVEVYPFQKSTIIFQIKHKHTINGSEMGTGKTLMGIAHALVTESKTLIICPSYLRNNWEREINKFSIETKSILNVSDKQDADIGIHGEYDFTIMSYDRFLNTEVLGKYDMVIFDEVHYLKSLEAKRTVKAIKWISDDPPEYLLGLSGTPVTKSILDWYSILLLVSFQKEEANGMDIKYFFPSYLKFARYFSIASQMRIKSKYGKEMKITKYSGIRHYEEFKKLLIGKYVRNLAKDHLELPDLVRKQVSFHNKKIKDDGLEEDFKKFEETGNVAFQTRKAQFAYEKAKFTASYAIELFESGESPILILSDHLNSAQKIAELVRAKMNTRIITGSTSPETRQNYVDNLQSGEIECLVATIGAIMTGFNMTKARNVIFNDLSWSPSHNAQAEKRLHRIGQKDTVTVHIICGGDIDERINQVLEKKITDLAKIT